MELGSSLHCISTPCHTRFTTIVPHCKNLKLPCHFNLLLNSSKIFWQKQRNSRLVEEINSKKTRFQCSCSSGDEIISSEGEDDDDDLTLPVETLEEEAKTLAREHSLSLSRQLLLDEDSDDQRGDKRAQRRAKKSIKQQTGVTAADIEIADWLRKGHSDKRIILAVNKCESPRKGLMQAADFWSLGFTPIPISAISGTGTGELLDLVSSEMKLSKALEETDEVEDRIPAIAIVGKPNVGKSSILNALVGEERMIVSPVSGTTRDAIDTEITGPDGQRYRLIDTAGIRRRAAVASGGSKTESLSVNRAFRAIRRSDVVALVIDAMACVTEQDYRIGERVEMEGKACIIVVNKWDTIPDKNSQTTFFYEKDVREKLRVLDWAQVVYSSATTGQRIEKIITAAGAAEKERSRRLSTSILNQVVHEAVSFKQPPMSRGGKRGRIYYCTQIIIRYQDHWRD